MGKEGVIPKKTPRGNKGGEQREKGVAGGWRIGQGSQKQTGKEENKAMKTKRTIRHTKKKKHSTVLADQDWGRWKEWGWGGETQVTIRGVCASLSEGLMKINMEKREKEKDTICNLL